VTLLVVPLLAGAALSGERLVELVYGADYAATGPLVLLLCVHLWMTALAFPISRALFALERADVELRANLVGLVVLAACGYPLVAAHGAAGGALGLSLAGAAANVGRAAWLAGLLRGARR
jgi:O-antigen/teichoic acid export membrane protein